MRKHFIKYLNQIYNFNSFFSAVQRFEILLIIIIIIIICGF